MAEEKGKRLWDKGEVTEQGVLEFTVGDDPVQDQQLVGWDAIASSAHARMLCEIGILEEEEALKLIQSLEEIFLEAEQGKFEIPYELEDCHGAIEARLVEKTGQAGKKIHTGRSRNDQVLVASRLYLKNSLVLILEELRTFAEVVLERVEKDRSVEMPGYTHMQQAMPTTIGVWLGSFAEWSLELIEQGVSLYHNIDSNPLGAASGFGTPLGLNRNRTTDLLGFDRVQRNPVNVQNSRGRAELKALHWCSDIGLLLEKLSWDLILYSTAEFNFFTLPESITTGSSIMPQKHNPDVLELIRARVARIRGSASELEWVIGKLPSNYHRDFQYTKSPVFRGIKDTLESIRLIELAVRSFTINEQVLDNSRTPELYATYAAFRKVKEGKAFRDAYKETADELNAGKIIPEDYADDLNVIIKENEKELSEAKAELTRLSKKVAAKKEKFEKVRAAAFEKKFSWTKKLFG